MAKKKEEKAPTREEILKSLRRGMERDEEIIFVPADQLFNVHEIKLDTGIFPLNLELGGGYPGGQNVILFGEPNVGKDMLINCALAALQREKGNEATAAFIYNEGEFDKGFARMLGVKLDWSKREIELLEEKRQKKFSLAQKRAMMKEGIGEIQFYSAATAQTAMDIILDLLGAGVYDMIVLNSIDGLLLSEAIDGVEKEDSISGSTKGRGGQRRAALLSDFFRFKSHLMQEPLRIKVGKKVVVDKRRTVCFFTSQLRMAQLAPNVYADKQQTGGWALKHYSALTLHMSRVKGKETYMGQKDKKGEDHVETSHLIHIEIRKGKYGVSDGGAVQVQYYKKDHISGGRVIPAGTIDVTKAVRSAMMQVGWAKQRGRYYDIQLPGDKEPLTLSGGRLAVDDYLFENPDVCLRAQKLLTERLCNAEIEEEQETVPSVGEDDGGEAREVDEG